MSVCSRSSCYALSGVNPNNNSGKRDTMGVIYYREASFCLMANFDHDSDGVPAW